MNIRRFIIALSLTVAASPVLAQEKDHLFEVTKYLNIFNSLYHELDAYYVDSLEAKRTIVMGIDAMLEDLDPYTEYYMDEDMGDLKMMTTGKYGGIGSLIRMRKDSTVIIGEPYEGMPAAEAGLQVGDVLLQIDTVDLKGKVTADVSDLLRGDPGTTFRLRIRRPGEDADREFNITRRNIKISAMPYYGMLSNVRHDDASRAIGYICLTQFTEGCAREVRRVVEELKEKGATSIVLDLRGNGGGLLSEAVDIVNIFVDKGTQIVETKAKIEEINTKYVTRMDPLDLNIPVVVLVNGQSASASEIVSGSLQDLKRATIIGARTFGKGLVQSTRELPYGGGVKLTTAKYYLPSGRCIQAIDYKSRREKGNAKKDEKGGIMPDIEVKHDTLANVVFYLSNDDVLVDWGTRYMQTHKELPDVTSFAITDQDVSDLLHMAEESKFKYDRISEKRLEDLKKTAQFEGYYDDAKVEFDALEAKLQHNLARDFEIHNRDIRRIMAQEVVKRFAFQKGSVIEALKSDEDLDKAVEVLSKK